jgi:hypothetical protein
LGQRPISEGNTKKNTILYTKDEWQRHKASPFVLNVMKDGILLLHTAKTAKSAKIGAARAIQACLVMAESRRF